MSTDLTALHRGFNATTRAHWDRYAAHRRRVTTLLRAGGNGQGRLCVLGAGNCNDLDLAALLQRHREVHLVDLDREAVEAGVARQRLPSGAAVRVFAPVDALARLGALQQRAPDAPLDDADVAAYAEAPARELPAQLDGPYDAVASCCLLTQLIDTLVHRFGETHPRFAALVQAVRLGHLRLLASLAAPGGVAVLVTDFLSSEAYPPLSTLAPPMLGRALAEQVQKGNVFHGVHPGALMQALRGDAVLAARAEAIETAQPWVWDIGARHYAVCAVRFRRRVEPQPAE